MGIPLNVLIIEDSEDDTLLLLRELRRGGYDPAYERVYSEETMKNALDKQPWDIIISDYVMPVFSGLDALKTLKDKGLDIPFILLSGKIGEETSVDAMKAGAQDYIVKGNLSRLIPAIQRELREAQIRKERRQALETLKQNEITLRAIFDSTQDGILLLDDNARYTEANSAAASIYGVNRDQLIGKSIADFFKPGLDWTKIWNAFLQAGSYQSEDEIIHPDESVSVVDNVGIANILPGQHLFVSHDITQRKLVELSLKNVNRTLRVLSDINQALIRGNDEAELLQEACRIAVQVGGYRMAWVGMAEQDDQKTIRHVCSCGHVEGFFDALKLTWADTEQGLTPAGIAIRTRKPYLVNDIRTDSTFSGYREEALKRGYASVIAVPLQSDDTLLGAVELYSGEVGAIAPEEERLFLEMSYDLAYGIISLRTREERDQAEEALRTSEERLKSIVNTIPSGIIMLNSDFRITYSNHAAQTIMGLTNSEIMGRTYDDPKWNILTIDGKPFPLEDRPFAHIMRTGEPVFDIEYTMGRPDGTRVFLSVNAAPYKDSSGRIAGMLASINDNTERKLAEDALRKSEKSLRNLYEGMMDAFVKVDISGRIEAYNPAFKYLIGYSDEEILGLTDLDITPKKWHAIQQKIVEEQINKRGYSDIFEKEYRRKDGSIVPVELRMYLLRDDSGVRSGMWAVVRDITERKQAEAHRKEFYKKTIMAATDGKLVISDYQEIAVIAGRKEASWEIGLGEDLGIIRAEAARIAVESGMDQNRVSDFVLCIGEATTNAWKHAGAGAGAASIHRSTDGLIFVVSDKGAGIEAINFPSVALKKGYTTGVSLGMGYKAMISIADQIYLATGPDGTTVAIYMKLHSPPATSLFETLPDTWS